MPRSIKKILLPVDFTHACSSSKEYACLIAGLLNAELHVLHVLPDNLPQPATSDTWLAPTEMPHLKIVEDAETLLVSSVKNSRIDERLVHCVVRFGNAVDQIVKYADDNQIDLIVIATHGRKGLSHAIIGSVAEKVVRLAKCPVLTVHPQE